MKTIIVGHDRSLITNLDTFLKVRWPDCCCLSAERAREGIDLINTADPDLAILDLEVLDMDGTEVIKKIRKFSRVPLMVLAPVKDDEMTVVKAFYHGADMYIRRPLHTIEFLSRVHALLRRTKKIKNDPYNLDFMRTCTISKSVKEVILSG